MKEQEQKKPHQWFKLDNAGKIFPGQNTSKWSNIFRISVTLTEDIDSHLLEKALKMTLVRFPCFDVRIRRGFFWYYLEKNKYEAPPVMEDIQNPCQRVRWNENLGFLFRVYYYKTRLSVEFFHALTDAYGASRFLMTLTACYLRLTGKDIPAGYSVLDINEQASSEELEDAFLKVTPSKVKKNRRKKFVYHARGTKMPAHMVNLTTGYMPVEVLKKEAKRYSVTITEFVAAVLVDVMYRKQLEEKRRQKEVSVQIPVNLRNTFGSQTLRNFSLCYDARIDPNLGEYTFEEILKSISLYLRYINNEKELRSMVTANLSLEKNFFMRGLPLFIKNAAIGLAFLITGEKTTSVLLSNLGVVKVPDEMNQYIDRVMLTAGPGKINGTRFTSVSCAGKFALSVANIYSESDIEREVFTRFVKMGIPVKIESNRNFDY